MNQEPLAAKGPGPGRLVTKNGFRYSVICIHHTRKGAEVQIPVGEGVSDLWLGIIRQ